MKKYTKGLLIAALLASAGFGISSTASAQEGRFVRTDVVLVAPGWHGDRYYDGHRYWARRDWERRHRPHHDGYRH